MVTPWTLILLRSPWVSDVGELNTVAEGGSSQEGVGVSTDKSMWVSDAAAWGSHWEVSTRVGRESVPGISGIHFSE